MQQSASKQHPGSVRSLFAMLTAVFFLFAAAPVQAATPDELRAEYTALDTELDSIIAGIAAARAAFKPTYNCPPDQTKKPDMDKLNALNSRISSAAASLGGRGRTNGLIENNELVGKVGQGQATDRFFEGRNSPTDNLTISQGQIASLRAKVQRARTDLANARQDLNGRPKTRQDCDARTDPIASVTYAPASDKPGAVVTANVTATTRSGKAVIITGLTLNAGTVGAATGTGGIGTANGTVTFKIDKIKRHGPHTLRLTVTGRPSGMPATAGSTSMTLTVPNYMVLNVPPRIVSLPGNPTAKPGQPLNYTGQIVVQDDNADDRNRGEVAAGTIRFTGHPADLDTNPGNAFDRFDRVTFVNHNAATGEITFNVSRNATAKKPHAHGIFKTDVEVTDSEAATAKSGAEFTIENVAPTGQIKVSPKRKYHAGDGIQVELTGAVHDDNGKDDIEKIEVDATAAGGAVYTKANGNLVVTEDGDTGYTFVTNPAKFGHPNNPGTFPIKSFVEDDGAPEQGNNTPEHTDFDTDIEVGNDPPRTSGSGYIYEREPGDQRRICPGEKFKAGVIVIDPEDDVLDVTAQITQTVGGAEVNVGPAVNMPDIPNSNTFVATLTAPNKPGTYKIRFHAKERNIVPPRETSTTITLIVDPCPGWEDAMADARLPEDKGDAPAVCGVPTDEQKGQLVAVAANTWTQIKPASPSAAIADVGGTAENWALSAGIRYAPDDFVAVRIKSLVNQPRVILGSKNRAGATGLSAEYAEFGLGMGYGENDWTTAERIDVDGDNASTFATPGQKPADSVMDGLDGIFSDGFESGDTSAWSMDDRNAPETNSFGSRARQNFETSFTGSDRLHTRLESNGAGFAEDGFCRGALDKTSKDAVVAHIRTRAPSVEEFVKNPEMRRAWNVATDGRAPAIADAGSNGEGLMRLMNQELSSYRCGEPVEIVLADGNCNTARTVMGH